jgi:TPP-dependent trihydroxycyclohexane-1,2-dione (THcHDO) dehydratase
VSAASAPAACCALVLCLLQAAHAALFPIDYDDAFFHKATNGLDRSVDSQLAASIPWTFNS